MYNASVIMGIISSGRLQFELKFTKLVYVNNVNLAIRRNYMRNLQKILSLFLILALVTGALLVSGCTEVADEVEEEIEEIDNEQIVSETVSFNDIIDTKWQWWGLVEAEPASQSVVPDPESYTIVFQSDGIYSIKADCNVGSGGYVQDGTDLVLNPGPMTLAYCGPESQDSTYLALLGDVTSFSIEDGNLVLYTGDSGDKMLFIEEDVTEE